jgi:hypothetical protein
VPSDETLPTEDLLKRNVTFQQTSRLRKNLKTTSFVEHLESKAEESRYVVMRLFLYYAIEIFPLWEQLHLISLLMVYLTDVCTILIFTIFYKTYFVI